jgi:DNA helicase HerA-like ATPase
VLAQLGNRVQHALRAYTPRDQKAVRAAAETFRPNPKLDTAKHHRTRRRRGAGLGVDEKGRPEIVERAFVCPPSSRIGPATDEERRAAIEGSAVYGTYEKTVDRESAFEKLRDRRGDANAASPTSPAPAQADSGDSGGGILGGLASILFGSTGPRGGKREGVVDAAAKSVARSVGSAVGREIVRGVLGSILGGGRRR